MVAARKHKVFDSELSASLKQIQHGIVIRLEGCFEGDIRGNRCSQMHHTNGASNCRVGNFRICKVTNNALLARL
ncbi:hypothetical protein D9M68_864510 [compost metagenome]